MVDLGRPELNMPEYQRPDGFERNRLQLELLLHDFENEAMLLLCLHFDQTGCHCGAWLQKVHAVVLALPGLRDALMLMTPDHKVEEVWYDVVLDTLADWCPYEGSFELVLMDN